jgi:hypothetical protein
MKLLKMIGVVLIAGLTFSGCSTEDIVSVGSVELTQEEIKEEINAKINMLDYGQQDFTGYTLLSRNYLETKEEVENIQSYFNEIDFTNFEDKFVIVDINESVEKNTRINYLKAKQNFYKILFNISKEEKISTFSLRYSYQTLREYTGNQMPDWFSVEIFLPDGAYLRNFENNLNTLLSINENSKNKLLLKSQKELNKIKKYLTRDYVEIASLINDKKYIESVKVKWLIKDLIAENENTEKKEFVSISNLFTLENLNEYLISMINLEYQFNDSIAINERKKEFQVSTMSYTKKNNLCYSHVLTNLKKFITVDSEISFKHKNVLTSPISCDLVQKEGEVI